MRLRVPRVDCFEQVIEPQRVRTVFMHIPDCCSCQNFVSTAPFSATGDARLFQIVGYARVEHVEDLRIDFQRDEHPLEELGGLWLWPLAAACAGRMASFRGR
jgi:hypothetical protein